MLPGTLPTPAFGSGTDIGDPAQVALTCQFSLITPVVSQILGGTITIHADSVFPIRAGLTGYVPGGSPIRGALRQCVRECLRQCVRECLRQRVRQCGSSGTDTAPCFAPSFIGDSVGHKTNPNPLLQVKWAAAGFTTTLIVNRPPNGKLHRWQPGAAGGRAARALQRDHPVGGSLTCGSTDPSPARAWWSSPWHPRCSC